MNPGKFTCWCTVPFLRGLPALLSGEVLPELDGVFWALLADSWGRSFPDIVFFCTFPPLVWPPERSDPAGEDFGLAPGFGFLSITVFPVGEPQAPEAVEFSRWAPPPVPFNTGFNSRRSLGFSWHLSWFNLIIFTSEWGVVLAFVLPEGAVWAVGPRASDFMVPDAAATDLAGEARGPCDTLIGGWVGLSHGDEVPERHFVGFCWRRKRDGERMKDYDGFAHC